MTQDEKLDSLEERLKSHARAFDGLLSIIPAKDYYGEDRSDQWQRKKQTKEEARAAKRAKLDPDNHKSAKDVLDEQAAALRKRKREDTNEGSDVANIPIEEPLSNLKQQQKPKKQKKQDSTGTETSPQEIREVIASDPTNNDSLRKAAAEKKQEKRRRKKERTEQKLAKAAAKKERQAQTAKQNATANKVEKAQATDPDDLTPSEPILTDPLDVGSLAPDFVGGDMDTIDIDDAENDNLDNPFSSASPSPTLASPIFDSPINHSGSSSISSIPPSTTSDLLHISTDVHKVPILTGTQDPDPAELKRRLQTRIEALRVARKADGPDGTQAKTRQELLESRRQKEEARKSHKKELRRRAKEEEAQKQAELLTNGSPLMSAPPAQTGSNKASNSFSFSRLQFGPGQRATATLDAIQESKTKPKGPSDPATALIAAQNKQNRLAGLDEEKRADIIEKDRWLNASKRAHGERIRDDTSLLKKTLKRKQKQKHKSEKEWDSRIEGVKKSVDMRQKKRESNLQKRRDEKGTKGGKKKSGKPKARPGFEGTFRAKAPSSSGPRRR